MDLAAKRRQLEAIRLAREAKQRSVQQQLQRGLSVTSSLANSSVISSPALGVNQPSDAGAGQKPPASSPHLHHTPNVEQTVGGLVDCNRRCSILGSVSSSKGNAWGVQVGLGAVVLKPTEIASPDCTQASSCADVMEGALEKEIRLEEKCLTALMPEGAMLLEHTLQAESLLNCKKRSVLDVAMLCFNAPSSSAHDGSDSLVVAAALSEVHHVEKTEDDVSKSGASNPGGVHLPSTSPSPSLNAEQVRASNGLVLLWCIPPGKKKSFSRNVVPLSFESEIRTLTYTRHRPNLLFGGAANGLIVVWCIDQALQGSRGNACRSGSLPLSSLSPAAFVAAAVPPIGRSFPSPHAHHSRVLGMAVHGDANHHHLYSISQDGRVCMWMPLHVRLLSSSRDGLLHGRPLGCIGSCAAFVDKAADAISKVVVGCLDGHVLEGRTKSSRTVELRPITISDDSSVQQNHLGVSVPSTSDMLQHGVQTPSSVDAAPPAHYAAVVAVAPHPLHADPRISDTVLTAGADGSCSLWLGSRRINIEGFSAQVNCLRWSPTHPSVFVAGENNGRVAAWDLSQNTCSPVAFLYLRSLAVAGDWACRTYASCAANSPVYQSTAVTSLSFSEDGTWLACGTAAGEVHVVHLRTDLVVENTTGSHRLDMTDADGLTTNTLSSPNAAISVSCGIADRKNATPSWIDARFAL